MLTMEDIILEGADVLRKKAEPVSFPLSDEDKQLGEEMLTFVKNSQDPEIAEKYQLRSGVGLAAPQIGASKQILSVVIPSLEDEGKITFEATLYNPRILSESVQQAALEGGEGCLSVNRDVPGYVPRPKRITLEYYDAEGNKYKKRFKNYEAIVLQHELDHLKGILFYDHINQEHPYQIDKNVTII